MTPNTGARPPQLNPDDRVRVVLQNGTEREWTVQTSAGRIHWGIPSPEDLWFPFSIKEWERV